MERLYSGVTKSNPRGGGDLALETFHRLGLRRIVILIVERQISDVRFGEIEVGRRQLGDSPGELAIVGIAPKTADQNEDLISAHVDLSLFRGRPSGPLRSKLGST